MFSCYKNIKSCTKKEEKNGFFLRNGGAVLEQTIRLFNGKSNPLRSYSSQQLNNATNNFHDTRIINHLQDDGHYKMYKGVIHDDDSGEDYTISVKKYTEDNVPLCWLEMIPTEVAVASQMSNHKNALKLLGYCLDSKIPMLVCEFPVHGNLSRFLIDGKNRNEPPRLPFESRLRIGIGIANALAYLHHGHSKTFIHRAIFNGAVYLDQDYGAKLFHFQDSLPIPEGKTHVDVDPITGITGHLSPEAAFFGRYTERSDVFAFGALFSEILTGKSLRHIFYAVPTGSNNSYAYWFDAWKNELNDNTLGEGEEETRLQIMKCVKLVEKCVKDDVAERPDMVEVAKALILIKTNKTLLP